RNFSHRFQYVVSLEPGKFTRTFYGARGVCDDLCLDWSRGKPRERCVESLAYKRGRVGRNFWSCRGICFVLVLKESADGSELCKPETKESFDLHWIQPVVRRARQCGQLCPHGWASRRLNSGCDCSATSAPDGWRRSFDGRFKCDHRHGRGTCVCAT